MSRTGIALGTLAAVGAGLIVGAAMLGDAEAASPAKVFFSDAECAVLEKANPGQTCQEVATEAKRHLLGNARDRIAQRRTDRFEALCDRDPDHARCRAMDGD